MPNVVAHRGVRLFGGPSGERVRKSRVKIRRERTPLHRRVVKPIENQHLLLFDRVAQSWATPTFRDLEVKAEVVRIYRKEKIPVDRRALTARIELVQLAPALTEILFFRPQGTLNKEPSGLSLEGFTYQRAILHILPCRNANASADAGSALEEPLAFELLQRFGDGWDTDA